MCARIWDYEAYSKSINTKPPSLEEDIHHRQGYYFGDDKWYHSAAKVISLCVLIVIVMFIYIYAWKTYRRHAREASQTSINGVSASHQEVNPHQQPIHRGGLHPSVIASLPTFLYNDTSTTTECAVCLCNLEEGEMARLIPTCNHMFHLQCINMWLSSHSTCPICRSPAQASNPTALHHEMSIWVPSMGPQVNSFSPAKTSSEGTSDDSSSKNSWDDANLISIDRRVQPHGQQTDGDKR
ncbi:RING-H2 finger protein ATL40-like [Macadamia integrifolia]|uniref:RING-H2 finger protein ATL40-like n=1 Tax=Macadamia integrifolia TaxID=60698 RepID=UPI001C4F41F6|nr:RING-H2 finger protein ATL40-like [Macadamia integrifolia]